MGNLSEPEESLQTQAVTGGWRLPECNWLDQTHRNSSEPQWQIFLVTNLQLRSLSFILFSCHYSFSSLLHFLAKVLSCTTSQPSLTYFHTMWRLSVKGSGWQRITKTYFPRWVMLGYIWPFIKPVTLSKTPKEDISRYENDFSIIAIPVIWWCSCFAFLVHSHPLFLPPSSSCHPASRAYASPVYSSNSSRRSLRDSALWWMAPSSDDGLPTPVLITPASFAVESSGNGTCGSLCNNMQQDRERHKNSPLVGLPMSEIFISDRRQESRE